MRSPSTVAWPLRIGDTTDRMPVPREAGSVHALAVSCLPMSGLSDREFLKQPGEIGVLIGQGQTAQVLRNLCYQVKITQNGHWNDLVQHIRDLFGVTILEPQFIAERSEITMAYKDASKNILDLSSSGRGLQQTLLLLTHVYANPGAVLLLDEPDAHLEILRQRQTYNLLIEVAERQNAQVIAASHSEVVLNEAADRDVVIAFVGQPHRIDDRNSQQVLAKPLRAILALNRPLPGRGDRLGAIPRKLHRLGHPQGIRGLLGTRGQGVFGESVREVRRNESAPQKRKANTSSACRKRRPTPTTSESRFSTDSKKNCEARGG